MKSLMLDCISGGCIISGFARGIPCECVAYNVSLEESRARFEEAWEIIKRAWTVEVLTYHSTFWFFQDVAIWPQPRLVVVQGACDTQTVGTLDAATV